MRVTVDRAPGTVPGGISETRGCFWKETGCMNIQERFLFSGRKQSRCPHIQFSHPVFHVVLTPETFYSFPISSVLKDPAAYYLVY